MIQFHIHCWKPSHWKIVYEIFLWLESFIIWWNCLDKIEQLQFYCLRAIIELPVHSSQHLISSSPSSSTWTFGQWRCNERERERECKKLNTQKTIYLWWTSRNEALHINSITLNYHRMISIRAMKPSSVRCTYYTYSSTVTRTTTNCFRFHFAVIPYAYHHHQTTNTYYNKYNMCLSYYVWCERVSSVRPWLIAFSWYINGLSANSGLCNLCSAYYYGRLKNRANYYRGFSIQLLHIISKLSMFTCSPILLCYAAIFRRTAAV